MLQSLIATVAEVKRALVLDQHRYNTEDQACRIIEDLSKCLAQADAEIHTFPLGDVRPISFRLFTDASLAKAIQVIEQAVKTVTDSFEGRGGVETVGLEGLKWVDEAVDVLDRALIIAGGLGREDEIHAILEGLRDVLEAGSDDDLEERPRKRIKTDGESVTSLLPNKAVMVPKIKLPVTRATSPSLEDFTIHATKQRTPLILEDTLSHWPAMQKWKDADYWMKATLGGRRLVPIEIGQSYTDEDWSQKLLPFKTFLEDYVLPLGRDDGEAETGYLAQHDLLRQIPGLRGDVVVPDYCYCEVLGTAKKDKENGNVVDEQSESATVPFTEDSDKASDLESEVTVHQNIWFGGRTVSPLHHDPYHNILCQVHGTKYIRLYAPRYSHCLFPRSARETAPHVPSAQKLADKSYTIDMSNNSQLDIYATELSPDEDWDEKWPGISDVPFLECVLEAGQALYIPVGWWHYVRSCSVGISVSFWWN